MLCICGVLSISLSSSGTYGCAAHLLANADDNVGWCSEAFYEKKNLNLVGHVLLFVIQNRDVQAVSAKDHSRF
jgi:hypothetical protein